MAQEHPFAPYVRILGKGPHLSRPLTREETRAAARMVLAGEVEPVQLGAFLCLLRVKTETPDEIAGWVEAVQETLAPPAGAPAADLDWSSYAGKSRRLPWFLLSVLLLAGNGVRVFMHGTDGHTANRVYARQALAALGLPVAASMAESAGHLAATNVAFLPLEHMQPRLHEIMGLKALLGLRSPIHTVARSLNPFRAAHQLVSVFHPNYRDVHQQAAQLLGQPRMAVFKGEGGEIERRPEKPCVVQTVVDGATGGEEWPPMAVTPPPGWDDVSDLGRLAALWRGESDDAYATAVVTGTAAVALRLLGRAPSPAAAEALAAEMWRNRARERLAGAA